MSVMAQDQMIIKSGSIAPYNGVLVPDLTYKKMHVDIFQKDLYKSELELCLETRYRDNDQDKHLWFASGLVGGLITALLISSMVQNLGE